MVFASLEFLTLFLPIFMLVYALSPPGGRNAVLLIGSWLFYGWLSPLFLLLHMVLTVIAWVRIPLQLPLLWWAWKSPTITILRSK